MALGRVLCALAAVVRADARAVEALEAARDAARARGGREGDTLVYEVGIDGVPRRIEFSSTETPTGLRSIASAFVREHGLRSGSGCDDEECVVSTLLADMPRRARPRTTAQLGFLPQGIPEEIV